MATGMRIRSTERRLEGHGASETGQMRRLSSSELSSARPRRRPRRGGGIACGGGVGVAGVATAAVVAVFTIAVALAREGDCGADEPEEGRQDSAAAAASGSVCEDNSSGSTDMLRLVGAWWRAAALSLACSMMVTAVVVMAMIGCLWCAVRVARWREEIFSGSPIVAEALTRAASLDRCGETEEGKRNCCCRPSSSFSSAESRGCTERSSTSRDDCCGGGGTGGFPSGEAHANDDLVGNIFRPGSQASRDFYTPSSVSTETGAGRGRASAGSATATATEEGRNGAVVFLTGVTGLVGQMVLFDLLRQGAAVSSGSTASVKEEEEEEGDVADEGLGGGGGGDDNSSGEEGGGVAVTSTGLRKVVVLVRKKKGVRPSDRLASIRDSPMFHPLRECGAWVDAEDVDAEAGTPVDPGANPTANADADADAGAGADGGTPPRRESSSSSTAYHIPPPKHRCSSGVGPLGLVRRKKKGSGRGAVVIAVEGELGEEGLGLTAESRALLAEAGVTHALHCAASVSFSDPLAEAAAINITGALRVAALVASWPSCG